MTLRVLVVDDDDLMRAGLTAVLSSAETIDVVGEAADGRSAVERAIALRPDVVLMDVRMPGLDGIAATRELLAVSPDVKVVVLTTFEQDDYVFGALSAGASGFLLKRTRPEELITAIHTVAAGDSLLSPSVTRTVIQRLAGQPAPDGKAEGQLDELTWQPGSWAIRRASSSCSHRMRPSTATAAARRRPCRCRWSAPSAWRRR